MLKVMEKVWRCTRVRDKEEIVFWKGLKKHVGHVFNSVTFENKNEIT